MARQTYAELERIVQKAIGQGGIESAVIFAVGRGSSELQLAAAAGIEGPALERLAAAVRNPAHPIRRTVSDDTPAFDVRPTAPGGPALRSHLPLVTRREGRARVAGVLAVTHQHGLDPGTRRVLEELADDAAALLDPKVTIMADEKEGERGHVG